MEQKINYKDTLNLPKTSFSMKANLAQKEPMMLKEWEREDLYNKIVESREGKKTFILHDGPPYANGHIHLGHVLNKILKDICVKYSSMKGFQARYVPGWDCHGLPIEHQLLKEMKITKHQIDQVKFRKKAYNYAMKFVKIQAKEFKRLGIFGDWENPYLTLTKRYESDVLSALADLYANGYIYKDLKPVNWCKTCETALAEAEVEYEDKESFSIYVQFNTDKKIDDKQVKFIIWTTTPWTLPANVAVALHPRLEYSFASTGKEVWVLLSEKVADVMEKAGIEDYKVLKKSKGSLIAEEFSSARHPFIDRESVIVLADYVTSEEGTGCVHTAPGHGQDDYITGRKYNLPVIMPVGDNGKFTAEAGEFEGLDVNDANKPIIEKLCSEKTLLYCEEITHSYPHCWRCKSAIIFRATEQWFMRVDHLDLRKRILDIIDKDVKWVPTSGQERISVMIEGRPDWCLSRQRYWGVPIPAFKCKSCGETFTSEEIIRNVADLATEKGADVWFEKTAEELLPKGTVCGKCGSDRFKKEEDILDVWFDSGVSHKAVLEARDELDFPADLYLEGSDQHRGWFQAAIITSVSTKERAPYREVLTHGFVVDSEGKKMSKSIGNVIHPDEIMKKYGADILRLWVASSDYDGDIKLSSEILERLADGYRKIRNTYRFLLSNLYDFDPVTDSIDIDELSEIDRWMLSRLSGLLERVTANYDSWEFYKVYRGVYDFCVYEVSSFYLDVLKDMLYTMAAGSRERRSAQTVISKLLQVLIRVMAPIISFTAEEAWSHLNCAKKAKSVHMAEWPDMAEEFKNFKNDELDSKWGKILEIRNSVMKFLELKRAEGMIGSSLEASVELLSDNDNMAGFIRENIDLFPGLFKVSQATIAENVRDGMEEVPEMDLRVSVKKAIGEKCQRCWNFRESVGKNKEHPELCKRCCEVVLERSCNG